MLNTKALRFSSAMKNSLTVPALALLLGFQPSMVPASPATPDNDWSYLQPHREQVIASLNIVELLKRHHYSKPPLNDARSAEIYDGYLKALDPSRSFFTAADVAGFNAWRTQFDDFLKSGNLEPGFSMYRKALERQGLRLDYTIALLKQGLKDMDFSVDEELMVDRDKAPWPKDQAELKDLWRKRLKDEVLRLKISGKTPENIRELLLKRYTNQRSRLAQTRSEDVFQTYINAFAQSYDPHTQYLSPDNAANFDINMSLSLEGIGAVLQNDNEYVQISRLVPAGPAEKSNQLNPADKIIGVAQANEDMVDVTGWRLDEVVKLIRGPRGTVVRLEIIPASNAPNDQTSKIVSITRDAVKLEEQAAHSSILHLKDNGRDYKLGVIELPAFYMDFKALRAGDRDYKSTTRDVKKLIAGLQKENIDGLVIDLRNNGGGSLQEATELTGLFIKEGPTVLVRNSDGRVDVLADETNDLYYRGPMAILVNRLSASASEIFAGAMQDYHRALIVGGQTFGKGTVQSIQPLNHGELKLTLAKFYRVSGQSTQDQGIVPDITYPASVDTKKIGESALPHALPWDSIRPAINAERNPFQPLLAELRNRHLERIQNNPDFIYTRNRLALAEELARETSVSLNEAKRRADQASIEKRQLELENALRQAKGEKLLTRQDLEEEERKPREPGLGQDQTKPEDDAFVTEAGKVLLDYVGLDALHERREALR